MHGYNLALAAAIDIFTRIAANTHFQIAPLTSLYFPSTFMVSGQYVSYYGMYNNYVCDMCMWHVHVACGMWHM